MSSDNPPKPIIDWVAIRHNAFTENPGRDWIALDTNLMPIGRASDLGAVMKGCPGAHAYVQQPVLVPYQAPSPVLAAVLQTHEEAKQAVAKGFGLAPVKIEGESYITDPTFDPLKTPSIGPAPTIEQRGEVLLVDDPRATEAPLDATIPADNATSGAAAFDHDGNGKVGGSRSRNRSRKAAQGE